MHARTKLICTLGPATSTPDLVHQLADAGASVFRVNLLHGTPEEQVERTGEGVSVAFGDRGEAQPLGWDVHAGPRPDQAAADHLGQDIIVNVLYYQLHRAVGEQHPVADTNVLRELRIGDGRAGLVADAAGRPKLERLTGP